MPKTCCNGATTARRWFSGARTRSSGACRAPNCTREVARFQQFLIAAGVGEGDRVAGYLPNLPETLIAMLATTALGAIWSSASPDFGVQGVLDRFGQIEPKVLVCVDGYWYNGKPVDCLAKNAEVVAQMPSLVKTVVVPYLDAAPEIGAIANAVGWPTWRTRRLAGARLTPAKEVIFKRVAFDHPLFIMFSSGTTGVPKCIVHCHGGVLLQHLKEHQLHSDVRPGDRLFYFTTCGWMMWNWLVSGLACGATLLLYDGSPFAAKGKVLFDYAAAEKMTHFGTSAKFIDAAAKLGLTPGKTHDLAALRAMFSTGSPLSPEGFDWVYREIKAGHPARLDFRRHRHRFLLRPRQSGAAGLARRNPVPRPGHGGRCVRRRRPAGARAKGRTGLHQALPGHAGRVLERRRTAASTAPPISSASPTSGATAILPN